MGAVCLHPGFWGWGPRFCSGLRLSSRHLVSAAEVKEVRVQVLPLRPGEEEAVEAAAAAAAATTTLGGPGGREEEKEEGGLASAPRGVGGGATRGTGIGNKRPFSAPWQGFLDALAGTGPALGQADIGAGSDNSEGGVRWGGGGRSWGRAGISHLGLAQSLGLRNLTLG